MADVLHVLAHLFGFYEWRHGPSETDAVARETKAFISEATYFRLYDKVLRDSFMCYEPDRFNDSYHTQWNQINLCSNTAYFPRQLSRSQISWKRFDSHGNTSSDSLPPSTLRNETTMPSQNISRSTSKPKEIVHEYLVLALLLPKHPFSADMLQMIRYTAPLYPQVVFTVANGLEMKEFCTQYNVYSFPKLLMFKNGSLIGRYTGPHRVLDLSVQMSIWTESFPRAVPYEARKSTWSANLTRSLPILSSPMNLSWNFLGLSATEPIKAHIENAGLFENHLFVISCFYFVFRIVYFLYKRQRRS